MGSSILNELSNDLNILNYFSNHYYFDIIIITIIVIITNIITNIIAIIFINNNIATYLSLRSFKADPNENKSLTDLC